MRPRRPHPRRRRRRERAYLLDVARGHHSLSESSNRALSVLVLTHNHLRRCRHPLIPFVSRRTRRVALAVVVVVVIQLAGGRRVSRELARTSAWNAPLNAKRWENPPRMNAIVRACVRACVHCARACAAGRGGAGRRRPIVHSERTGDPFHSGCAHVYCLHIEYISFQKSESHVLALY